MKVQCDVCKEEEAAVVFCCADEAALCGPCDSRVHSANKLAGKHRRFSLLHPSSPHQFPLCDICKEKRALLFCHEDRAILCRNCDAPIHDANDFTRKHSRFLLTGIRLSPFAAPATPEATASSSDTPCSIAAASSTTTTASAAGECPPATVGKPNQCSRHILVDCASTQQKKSAAAAKEITDHATASTATGSGRGMMAMEDAILCNRTSAATAAATATGGRSISEYLMNELPGWHVEDLLLESCPAAHLATFDFPKMPGEDLTPFLEEDLDPAAAAAGGASQWQDGENKKIPAWWVPRVPQFCPVISAPPLVHGQQPLLDQAMTMGLGGGALTELMSRQLQQHHHQHHTHRWTPDVEGFTVPELVGANPKPPAHKRPKPAS